MKFFIIACFRDVAAAARPSVSSVELRRVEELAVCGLRVNRARKGDAQRKPRHAVRACN
jgi:hypothetical protein